MLPTLALIASNVVLILVVLITNSRERDKRRCLEEGIWHLKKEVNRTQDAIRKHLDIQLVGSSPKG